MMEQPVFPEKGVVAVVQATPTPGGKAYDDMVFEIVGGMGGRKCFI